MKSISRKKFIFLIREIDILFFGSAKIKMAEFEKKNQFLKLFYCGKNQVSEYDDDDDERGKFK